MSKCKILISYHKPSSILESDILTPIEVGRAMKNNNEYICNMIGDNTGENISDKNKNYCELTAQYWAWKNQDKLDYPDYIGFMHYRRHLNFNVENKFNENKFGLIENRNLDDFYIEKFKLNDKQILKLIDKYDIITANPWDVRNVGSKNTYNHYETSNSKLHIKDYKKALDILTEKYPEYREDIEIYNESAFGYFTNIFIMKKDLFNQYCEWLFDILFQLEKEVDISNYNYQEARIFGYISEWLYGIYIFHLKRTTNLKIKDLQRTSISNSDIIQNQNNINICFSTDNNYAQHLGVAIASVLKTTKTKKGIDIYVLIDRNFKKKNKKKLKRIERLKKNSTINFITIDESLFKNFPLLSDQHFTIPTYYRYIIPKLLNKINKLIYLDCDLIVKEDIEKLYNIDIGENYIGAVQDTLCYENQKRLNLIKGKYYCNAGVLILNLKKLRKDNIPEKLIKWTQKNATRIKWLDQDVINCVLEDGIYYLDLGWNFQHFPGDIIRFEKEEFNRVKKHPKIVHYIGYIKPWDCTIGRLYGYLYFQYLLFTPWKYKIIIYFIKKIIYLIKKILQNIFSIRNDNRKTHKILTILGLKFKFRRRSNAKN